MRLSRNYDRTRFAAEILQEAAAVLLRGVKGDAREKFTVEVEEGAWTHDTEEEFIADYRRSSRGALYMKTVANHILWVQSFPGSVLVEIEAPTRARVQEAFEVFERNRAAARLPEPPVSPEPQEPPPIIFVGHGRNPAWRDLKDHLHEKHGVEVEAYEIGARAGHAIRDILQDMLRKSSFAVLVMTGEDETADGALRARQNVVHEAGLFQGRLGFSRAIVLLEEGTEAFSNIQGIEQIRFSRGNIKETFGEVLATLKREFGERGLTTGSSSDVPRAARG